MPTLDAEGTADVRCLSLICKQALTRLRPSTRRRSDLPACTPLQQVAFIAPAHMCAGRLTGAHLAGATVTIVIGLRPGFMWEKRCLTVRVEVRFEGRVHVG